MKIKDNKNIFCSISAGYSSVMMAAKIRDWYPDHNIIFGMANTSKEKKESLEFMNACDIFFNLNMVWIETIFNPEKGKGVNFKIVKYKDLKTEGEIFEEGIKKLGIPSKINKWCNRDMKLNPLKKYADSVFGLNNYSIAVGLRADEMDRVRKDYFENNVFYPLMDNKIYSRDRNYFWENQTIKIKIPAFKGNCDDCFERSKRKKLTIYVENPETPIWWNEMEKKYSTIPINGKKAYNSFAENGGAFFNRSNESIELLIEQAKLPFKKATDEYIYESDSLDLEDDCGSGCQVF